MRVGGFAQSRVMRTMRAKGLGVARLLLLALSVQLFSPVVGLAGLGQLAALEADIASSLCHDSGTAGIPVGDADARMAKHCVFCLPLVGGDAIALGEMAPSVPVAGLLVVFSPHDDFRLIVQRRDFAFARAPPSISATI